MRPFTDDRLESLRGEVRALAARLPRRGRDESDGRAVLALLAESGLLRLLVSAAHGGREPEVAPLALVVAREELAYASGVADALFAVQGLGAWPIARAGRADVKARWLPAFAAGREIATFAATEPEAGSDLAAMTTRARREGDDYVLDGHKVFISSAPLATVHVVFARTSDDGERGRRLSAFVVPAAAEGVDVTPMDLLTSHHIGQLRLRNVRVPASHLLGNEGDGLSLCLSTLDVFRPTVGASACGIARRALDEALRRTRVRKQFGRALAEQQSVAFALAEMATLLESARGLVYRAAWSATHESRTTLASMAKLSATEAAQTIVDRALQLHGASGLVRGSVIESLYREVRALRIYEGTSEIQKLVIARALLGEERAS